MSGVDYFPQRVRDVLSIQRNESPFYPTFGMRFFEYFETFRGSRGSTSSLSSMSSARPPCPSTIPLRAKCKLRCNA